MESSKAVQNDKTIKYKAERERETGKNIGGDMMRWWWVTNCLIQMIQITRTEDRILLN